MEKSTCIVCYRNPLRKRNKSDDSFSTTKANSVLLEDQLTVFYFVAKFLGYPVVEGCDGGVERLLAEIGNPCEWVGFCEECVGLVEKAKLLYIQIQQIQVELKELRTKVERRVVESYRIDDEDSVGELGKMVRKAIYRNCIQKGFHGRREDGDAQEPIADVDLNVQVKVETDDASESNELMSPMFFEENNEDFSSPGRICNEDGVDLKDFVIEPENLDANRSSGRCKRTRHFRNKLCPDFEIETGDEYEDNDGPTQEMWDPLDDDFDVEDDGDEFSVGRESDETSEEESEDEEDLKSERPRRSLRSNIHESRDSNKKPRSSKSKPFGKPTHTINDKTCPVCFKLFLRSDRMRTHLNVKHEKSMSYSCDLCNKTFLAHESLKIHKRKKHLEKDQGSQSSKKSQRSEVAAPGRKSSSRVRYTTKDKTCPVCSKVFPRADRMRHHLNAKHEKKAAYSCDICGKPFYYQDSLKGHKRTHLSHEERKELELSEKTLDGSASEGTEVDKKKNKYTLKDKTCPVCFKIFLRVGRMKNHLNAKHEKSVMYSWDICLKSFYTQESLRLHKQTHLTDVEIRELELGAKEGGNKLAAAVSSSGEASLGDHSKQVIEDEVQGRTCPICKQLFPNINAKRIHLENTHCPNRTHYTCDKCGKSFQKAAKAHYEAHMHWHETGIYIGRFMCPYEGCTMTFPSKLRYENHIVKHTGEKRYLCPDCGKGFTQKCALEKHLVVFHSQNPPKFVCSICGKVFKTNTNLQQHMRSISHGGPGFGSNKSKHRSKNARTSAVSTNDTSSSNYPNEYLS